MDTASAMAFPVNYPERWSVLTNLYDQYRKYFDDRDDAYRAAYLSAFLATCNDFARFAACDDESLHLLVVTKYYDRVFS